MTEFILFKSNTIIVYTIYAVIVTQPEIREIYYVRNFALDINLNIGLIYRTC